MPPKKRAAPGAAALTPAKRAKKVGIGATSVINDASTLASGRSKRASTGEINYSLKRAKKQPTVPSPAAVNKPAQTAVAQQEDPVAAATKKRGRPANTSSAHPLVHSDIPKPRGRPRKDAATTSPAKAAATSPKLAKPRGRPPGPPSKASSTAGKVLKPATKAKKPAIKSKAKAKATPASAAANKSAEAVNEDEGEETAKESDWEHVDETQYWLMKAEPQSRLENGRDVAFSIDHLERATEAEPWDGVRNLAARNNMRAMKKGDQAFFYHSNCKVPGIAGIMEIVEEHTVDKSAFDKGHPYYDPKSDPKKPKWENVQVKFVRKFPQLVALTELKSFAKEGGALAGMQTLRQSRLSVSSVQPAEWHFIMGLIDSPDDELDEDVEAARGQQVQVTETTVRRLPNGAAHDEGFDDDDEEGAIQSKLTIAQSMGAEAAETGD